MSRGGSRPGAGRPPGSGNNPDAEMLATAEKLGLEIIPGSSLDILRRIYSGKMRVASPTGRAKLEAARAAAPYEYARLTDATIRQGNAWDAMTEEQVDEHIIVSLGQLAKKGDMRPKLIEWAKLELGLIEKPNSATPAGDNVVPLRH